jgi:hypothetical protein
MMMRELTDYLLFACGPWRVVSLFYIYILFIA